VNAGEGDGMQTLENLAPNLWIATRPLRTFVGDIGTRMTVIKLADGSLFLHSPVRLDADTKRALDETGSVRAIIAPSRAHHLFVGDYVAAYPEAKVHGAPGLAEKRKDLKFDSILGDDPHPDWAGQIEQHLFRGASILNEVIFFHPTTRTLILTDLAFNVPANESRAPVFYWLTGARGRFGPHRLVRLMIRDRKAARQSIERIFQWDFDRVTVTHGEVLESGGKERLASGFPFL
jgi:Domain of unknown function (DUF4336)